MELAFVVIACVSGVTLVVSVMLQDSKNAGFGAAFGGADSAQFQKGSMEELYDRITKYSAIVWIISCAIVAFMKYGGI